MHVLRREMVYRDRLCPFDHCDDWDGYSGLVKVLLVDLLEDSLCHHNTTPTTISHIIKVTIALHFFCTGSFESSGAFPLQSTSEANNLHDKNKTTTMIMNESFHSANDKRKVAANITSFSVSFLYISLTNQSRVNN